ncbi:MAG: hypothetical protein IKU32_07635 [Clostridia bacterium]|nr:hypothetical protein [Clostridia bacterium]
MAYYINHDGFSSKAYKKNKRKYTSRYFSHAHRPHTPQKGDSGGSMLAKIGICGLLAGLILLADYTDKSKIMEVSSSIEEKTEDIGGDYLGKLRFVELPGIIQVFSSDAILRIDAAYKEYRLNEDKTILTISGISSENFASPATGTVKTLSVQNDNTLIDLSMDGDIVISFYAKGKSTVEEGQPIKSGDTLYSFIDTVDISMTKGGRPVNPAEYFDLRNQMLS